MAQAVAAIPRKWDSTKIKFWVLTALVFMLFLVAVFARQVAPHDPYAQNLSNALSSPSWTYPLGTDQYGRCLLSRVIMGLQTTMLSSLGLVAFVSIFGTAVGMYCGYVGGWVDSVVMRISDVFLAFPGMVFAIAVAGVLGGGIVNAVLALAVISWPKFARIARGQVLTMKDAPFIQAAKLAGSNRFQIIAKHLLPNIIGPIVVTATLDIGTMIMELAGLSFLGLGAMPPTAEWGSMMSGTRSMLQTSPWVILAPGGAIFVTVSIFNLFGDNIRDVLGTKRR